MDIGFAKRVICNDGILKANKESKEKNKVKQTGSIDSIMQK